MSDKDSPPVLVDLALQGGGSHGAFTWGVLDRLLEEPGIRINALSGTSAGAMNACAVVEGLANGGPEAARDNLQAYWEAVGQAARFSPYRRSAFERMTGGWSLANSPAFAWARTMLRSVSPYEFNPFDINPLRPIVEAQFDFDAINDCRSADLFLCATNVRTGRPKIFRQGEITADAVLASACLPFLSQAVEIDGEAYWDGGYMGNPPLFPLIDESEARDLIIVQINPVERAGVPRTAWEIDDRLNEITFNSSLIKELRALFLLSETIREGGLEREAYRDARLHLIADTDELPSLGASTKMNAEPEFLDHLHDLGRRTADKWLADHGAKLGRNSSYTPDFVFEESLMPAHLENGLRKKMRRG
ncbi:patatin-like phospholipase family protein [Oceanomicrobium pacificus]|uniref:Patatin-like phospholipase family protein n=1 Tax=Oceanomicrobium pacificus TaxID=2692916 RepID=A0A6B0TMQ0_9RHOB|nr:patatin-like phospholipase family protein [Oceanomicrobium pacificus]MXU65136.1 patatin-like phospholipase family protein [Oceanomicrobium pacificus]